MELDEKLLDTKPFFQGALTYDNGQYTCNILV